MSTDAAATRGGSRIPSLIITSGSHRGQRILLPSTGIVLGREGKLTSFFRDDPLVSRGHAHIYLADDRSVQVADLNSANGTFINGNVIRSLTRLADGDVLRIGSTDMQLDSPPPDTQPADETVMLHDIRPSWSDPLADRPAPPEQHWYEERQGLPSAVAWPDAEAEAHYGPGEVPRHQPPSTHPPTNARPPRPRS